MKNCNERPCKPLKISEMPGVTHIHPEDLIPIVHHGDNRAIPVQLLLDIINHFQPELPENLYDKIITAFENSKTAILASNKAYDLADDLQVKVDTLDKNQVEIKSSLGEINLKLDLLDKNVKQAEKDLDLKITPVNNIDNSVIYRIELGDQLKGEIQVPNTSATISFAGGKFEQLTEPYSVNGNSKTIYIPTSSSQIDMRTLDLPTYDLNIKNGPFNVEMFNTTPSTTGDTGVYNGKYKVNLTIPKTADDIEGLTKEKLGYTQPHIEMGYTEYDDAKGNISVSYLDGFGLNIEDAVLIPVAEPDHIGLMSSEDKAKLDSISVTDGVIDKSSLPDLNNTVEHGYYNKLSDTFHYDAKGVDLITPEENTIYIDDGTHIAYTWNGESYEPFSENNNDLYSTVSKLYAEDVIDVVPSYNTDSGDLTGSKGYGAVNPNCTFSILVNRRDFKGRTTLDRAIIIKGIFPITEKLANLEESGSSYLNYGDLIFKVPTKTTELEDADRITAIENRIKALEDKLNNQ